MRKRRLLAVRLTAAAFCSLVAGSLALAIVGGPLDGNTHPSVGYIFGQQTDPNTCHGEVAGTCSAILISPTVAVSSGGCSDIFAHPELYGYNLTAVWINFNGNDPFDCSTASRVDSIVIHPNFDEQHLNSPNNIGVFILTAPAAVAPAILPAADSQGGYSNGDPFEIVNWGPDVNGNINTYRRRLGPAKFKSSNADALKLQLTLPGSQICIGGTEGGGAFLPESQNLTAFISSPGNNCKTTDFLRLDTQSVRDFLDDYVTLP